MGKRKLEAAAQALKDTITLKVVWEPFLLRPGMPEEGVPKPPADPRNPRVGAHMKSAGQSVGIDFTGKTDIYPNTLQAHAMLDYAKTLPGDTQDKLSEALFQAYFTDGVAPMGDALVPICEKVGISADITKSIISDEARLQVARLAAKSWSERGVTGVPYFYMNGKGMFSGAQEVNTIISAVQMAADRFPLPNQSAASPL